MYDDQLEDICARLCLLSTLERNPDEPAPLSRSKVREMLKCGTLSGLVLRENGAFSLQTIERARALLARASAVYTRLEAYQALGYCALLPGSESWPYRLNRLADGMPLYLFAKGNRKLLCGRLIAVAGSRAISNATKEKAAKIGRILAKAGMTVISGGAQGVDSIVQHAALEAGGSVIIVPAMKGEEMLRSSVNRLALDEGRMLILCETPPDEPFSAQKALTRNHTIYALGDLAIVVAARKGVGGSWSGASACLKGNWSPVYILDEQGVDFEGNTALIDMGALRMQIDEGETPEDLLLEGMNIQTLMHLGLVRQRTLFDMENL